MGLAVVAVGLPALIFTGYSHLMESEYFEVEYVDVEGLDHLEEQQFLQAAEEVAGEHIIDVRPGRLETVMQQLPFVAEARVQRRFPNRLHVAIDEHQPVAILVDEGFWLVDRGGEVFLQLDSAHHRERLWQLPMVTGLTRAQMQTEQGQQLLHQGLEVYRLYRHKQLHERQPVDEIHVDELLGVSLMVGDTGTEVRLGRGRWEERLERFAAVQASLIRRGLDAAYVLVDQENDSGRVVVGQRTEPSDGDVRSIHHADRE